MTRFVRATGKNDLINGSAKVIIVDGRNIALFRVKDEYYALANTCLHRAGPLGEGELKDYQVTCPWHGWKYDIRDGSFTVIPTLKVKTYNVKEEDDGVFVEVED